MLTELSGASNLPSHRSSKDQKKKITSSPFCEVSQQKHRRASSLSRLRTPRCRDGGKLQLLAGAVCLGNEGLCSAALLPNMQTILTASGVPCTAPCLRRSASASSSSSLCVCERGGKAQPGHIRASPCPGRAAQHCAPHLFPPCFSQNLYLTEGLGLGHTLASASISPDICGMHHAAKISSFLILLLFCFPSTLGGKKKK